MVHSSPLKACNPLPVLLSHAPELRLGHVSQQSVLDSDPALKGRPDRLLAQTQLGCQVVALRVSSWIAEIPTLVERGSLECLDR